MTGQLMPYWRDESRSRTNAGMREVLSKRLPTVKVLAGRDVAIPLD